MIERLQALFARRVRGFRVVEVAAVGFLTVLVLGVYWSKAGAGAEGAKIAATTKQIDEETRKVRLLSAELAYLQQPERLERLSEQYAAVAPVSPKREVTPEAVGLLVRGGLAHQPRPASPPLGASSAAPVSSQ